MNHSTSSQLGTRPIFPLIISLSVPVMFSLLTNALYNVVDSIYIARYSTYGMTAISLSFPLQTLITAVGSGTGVGAGILIAQKYGAGNQQRGKTIALHSLLLCLFNWVIFIAFAALGAAPYFAAFTHTAAVGTLGVQYIRIICFFSLGTLTENVTARILHAGGDTFRPMLYQIIGAAVNIVLDPILIFGYLGAPELGITGAAIATVVGQFCSMGLSVATVIRQGALPNPIKETKLTLRTAADIYVAGMPTIIMTALVSLYITGLNAVLIRFSEAAVAVLGVYYKLQTFLLMPTMGLAQGCTPVLSYNFGSGNYPRMWKTLQVSLALSTGTLTLGTVLFWVFPQQLLGLFSATADMLHIGIPALRIISLSFPLFGVTILVPMLCQTAGHNRWNIAVTLLRQVVLLVPIAWLLSHLGIDPVWFTYPISEFLAALLCAYYALRLHREHFHFTKRPAAS